MKEDEILRSVCHDIELISGIKAVIWNEDMQVIHAQPGSMCNFCAEVRKNPVRASKCTECDRYAFTRCTGAQEIYVYRCHMGLMEAISPIVENGLPIGYLMFGQVLPKGEVSNVKSIINALPSDASKEALYTALAEMQETSEEQIRAATRILAMATSYVKLHSLMPKPKSTLVRKITQFVADHLSDESLAVDTVCCSIGISRTSLYTICKQSFGMGMSDYIRKTRVERAVQLIEKTDLPLTAIAEIVGVSSQDHLSKLVKKQLGISPKQIRKQQ